MAIPVTRGVTGTVLNTVASGVAGYPTATALGDLCILAVESANEAVSLTDAQGFVLLGQIGTGVAGAVGSVRLTLFWKIAEAAAASMTAPTVADAGDHVFGKIFAWSGCVATEQPVDLLASQTNASSTAASSPGGVTTTADVLVVCFLAHAIDATGTQFSLPVNADLSAVTLRGDGSGTSGVGGGLTAITGGLSVAGAFGATTATLAAASAQAVMTLAVRANALPVASGAAAAVILSEGY